MKDPLYQTTKCWECCNVRIRLVLARRSLGELCMPKLACCKSDLSLGIFRCKKVPKKFQSSRDAFIPSTGHSATTHTDTGTAGAANNGKESRVETFLVFLLGIFILALTCALGFVLWFVPRPRVVYAERMRQGDDGST